MFSERGVHGTAANDHEISNHTETVSWGYAGTTPGAYMITVTGASGPVNAISELFRSDER